MKIRNRRFLLLLPVSLLIAGCNSPVSAKDASVALSKAYTQMLDTVVDGITLDQTLKGTIDIKNFEDGSETATNSIYIDGEEGFSFKGVDLLGDTPQASLSITGKGSATVDTSETSVDEEINAYYSEGVIYGDVSKATSIQQLEPALEANPKFKVQAGLLKDFMGVEGEVTVRDLMETMGEMELPTAEEMSSSAEEFFGGFSGFSATTVSGGTKISLKVNNDTITDYIVSMYTKDIDMSSIPSYVSFDIDALREEAAAMVDAYGSFDLTLYVVLTGDTLSEISFNADLDLAIPDSSGKVYTAEDVASVFEGVKIKANIEFSIKLDMNATPTITLPTDLDTYTMIQDN